MKRTIVLGVSIALFTTLFGGLAAADPAGDSSVRADVVTQVDDGAQPAGSSILKRCRRLFGEDELTATVKKKCVQIWKRWCKAHPRARHCPRPEPPPPCRITDQVVDRRCVPVPCLRADQIVDRRCVPDPCRVLDAAGDRWCDPCKVTDHVVDWRCVPDPCRVTDLTADRVCVPYPCVNGDGAIVKCMPIPTERPTDRPVVRPDRPLERPTEKPADTRPQDDVLGRPADKPSDIRPDDRILDRPVDRLTDRVGNDVHLRTIDADS